MRRSLLITLAITMVPVLLSVQAVELHAQGGVTFSGTELLGRPTDHSVTVNVLADANLEAYFEYGTTSGVYTDQTGTITSTANEPIEVVIDGLQGNTRYYYRTVYREVDATDWIARDEHSFHTQRPPGNTFTFTIIADSHLGFGGTANLYNQTLLNVLADNPDFHIDLGDTFPMDSVSTIAQAQQAYLDQRPYMGLISHSAPIFLALGNHENEEGWNLDDTPSLPLLSVNARKLYYPNPVPDGFYSGNTDTLAAIDGDGLREDYYAWQWGDALFVVLDPFWYTMIKPYIGGIGGELNDETVIGDRWDWTLGEQQYLWFKQTLEGSSATFKFVFAHHVTGGTQPYVRGGAEAAPYFEWGGLNWDGTWGFGDERPGWDDPIHQLMVQYGVTAFFHGHDHEYAKEEKDGIVYQLCPQPGDSSYGYGFNLYHESDPYTDVVLPNSGHLRVTVSPSQVTVDYVRAYISGAGTNGEVAYTYTILPSTSTPTPTATDTPLPTDTPTLAPTDTPTLSAASTATPTATDTPLPTDTPTSAPTDTPTLTPAPSPTLAPSPGIFEIGHETGDLTEYDSTTTDGGDLSVTAAAALGGTDYGLSAFIDDTNVIYGEKTFTLTSNVYRLRFDIDPNTLTMAHNDNFPVNVTLDGTQRAKTLVYLGYSTATGYRIQLAVGNDTGWSFTGWSAITDAEHYVEVQVQYASSATASDGTATLWIDGVEQQQMTGIDLFDLAKPDRARFGALLGIDAGTSGTLYLDEFEFD
jgi:hypothetical protein